MKKPCLYPKYESWAKEWAGDKNEIKSQVK